MLEIDTPAGLDAHVGQPMGESEWVVVSQEMIDTFAQATGDRQWIHVDAERARTEMPGGRTIAHGYLTLSLLPGLGHSILTVRRRSRAVNYGSNKVRFTSPVPSGSRVRARQTLLASEPVAGGRRVTIEATVEIEGQDRPALVAEIMAVFYD